MGRQVVSLEVSISPAGQRHCPVCLALSRHRWEQPRISHGLGAVGRRAGCIICRIAGSASAELTPYHAPKAHTQPSSGQDGETDALRGPETLAHRDCCPSTTGMGVQLPLPPHSEDNSVAQDGRSAELTQKSLGLPSKVPGGHGAAHAV